MHIPRYRNETLGRETFGLLGPEYDENSLLFVPLVVSILFVCVFFFFPSILCPRSFSFGTFVLFFFFEALQKLVVRETNEVQIHT